jgi:exonuclease SbcC
MIELLLTNFQSHKETNLHFDKGVNVIVGVSDSGKSAIMRALRWLWTSRPLGDYFVRWGEKECNVKLVINGNEIIRGKEKKQNYYSVNGKVLEAIKAEVPSEVSEVLRLEDINWQGQRDMDFLLSLSPLEASKYIQRLCGLEAVPPILSSLSSMELENRKQQKEIEERKTDAENKVKAFANFGEVEIAAEELQVKQNKFDKIKAKEKDLEHYVLSAKNANNRLEKGKRIPQMGHFAEQLKTLLPEQKNLSENINSFEKQLKEFAFLENRLCRFADTSKLVFLAENLRRLNTKKSALPELKTLEYCTSSGRALQGLETKRSILWAIASAKRAAEVAIDNKWAFEEQDRIITDIISLITMTRCDLRKNIENLTAAQAALPKLCPACGKPMEEK